MALAAVLVGWNGHIEVPDLTADLMAIHRAEVFIGVFIGAVTFTGLVVAFRKLSARMKSSPLMLSGKHLVASIGGGDMPVVVSILNSYSGWAHHPRIRHGMAQAQYPVAELAHQLRERGVNVRFGIYPVAGCLQGT